MQFLAFKCIIKSKSVILKMKNSNLYARNSTDKGGGGGGGGGGKN